MYLTRMIYVSTIAEKLDFNELAKVAHTNNKKHHLSGLLAFDRKYCVQVIEGGRTSVSNLLKNIFADTRHKEVVILEFDYIEKREFGEWTMQFVPLDASTKEIIFKHSVGKTFDPYALTKENVHSFLLDMRPAAKAS